MPESSTFTWKKRMMFHINPRTSEGLPSAISAASMLTSLTWKEAVDERKTPRSRIYHLHHHPRPDAADCILLFVIAKDNLLRDTQYVKLYSIKKHTVLTMSGWHPKALQALMSMDSVYPNHKPIM